MLNYILPRYYNCSFMKQKQTPPNPKHRDIPVSLRTTEDEIKYALFKGMGKQKPLNQEPPIKEWKLWKLIDNAFPYTSVFETSHMLVPKRITSELDLTPEEVTELRLIFKELDSIYDCRLTNFSKKQSISHHFHIHMLIYKTQRKDVTL